MRAIRWLAVGVLGSVLLCSAASAGKVYCGSYMCFEVKVAAGGQTADQRSAHAMNVLNKHLGSPQGNFTLRNQGNNVEVLLNGERLILVTPADREAASARTVRVLADQWKGATEKAYIATRPR